LNPANSGNDPSVIPQGLVITHGKYVVVTNKWVTSGSRGSVIMWFFHISGTMGRYTDVRLDVGVKLTIPHRIAMETQTEWFIEEK
jgi:hypothetical protein